MIINICYYDIFEMINVSSFWMQRFYFNAKVPARRISYAISKGSHYSQQFRKALEQAGECNHYLTSVAHYAQ